MPKTRTCLRCEKDFLTGFSPLCKECRWWVNYWRKYDAPKGIHWDYTEDKFYVDADNNILPDKYFKERWLKRNK